MEASSPVVAVVTDTAACIPASLRKQYNIEVVPYWVHLGNESYVSGVDIGPETFFARLRAEPELEARTGVPAVAKFINAYRRLAKQAEGIISIHIAGKQSGTCSAAVLASRECPVPVEVVDSGTTAMGEGFAVLEAARAAAQGLSLEQIVSKVRPMASNLGLFALLENLTYVLRGGRISSAAGKVGSLLNIQPLVKAADNRVGLVGQVRRRSKGLQQLLAKIRDEVGDHPVHLAVHYAEDEAEGHSLLEQCQEHLHCVESYLTRVPVELGVHSGPGAIGIAYYVERENLGLREQLERLGEQAKDAIRSRLPG